ncbi:MULTISPECIES: hypothetical protein [Seleniivibrio]|uniref:hypothetical protein n=1 Tax=Seleniivibrio TaxID=1649493 RepID=UPI0025E5A02D|nr:MULTISPECIES: hypothetical protein [Seleniivibrio]MCD8553448.1 hypothetical protein [Seleniivibrio sp.]
MPEEKKLSPMQKKRRYTKYAMTAALGVLVVSGFNKGKTSRNIHSIAGVALVGLSVYHTFLYKNRS